MIDFSQKPIRYSCQHSGHLATSVPQAKQVAYSAYLVGEGNPLQHGEVSSPSGLCKSRLQASANTRGGGWIRSQRLVRLVKNQHSKIAIHESFAPCGCTDQAVRKLWTSSCQDGYVETMLASKDLHIGPPRPCVSLGEAALTQICTSETCQSTSQKHMSVTQHMSVKTYQYCSQPWIRWPIARPRM